MPEIACPNCGERLQVPPDLAQQSIRCGGCQFVIEPGSMPKRRPDDTERLGERELRDDDRPRRRREYDDDRFNDRPMPKKKGSLTWLWLLLGCGGLLGLGCCGVGGLLIYQEQNQTWVKFHSPDGKFSVDLPTKSPKVKTRTNPVGGLQTTYEVETNFGREAYLVSHTDLTPANYTPELIALALDTAIDEMKKSQSGLKVTELNRASAKYYGGDGKEFEAQIVDSKNNTGRMIMRVFIVNQRLYMLVAIGTTGGTSKQNLDKFFYSFLPSDAPKK